MHVGNMYWLIIGGLCYPLYQSIIKVSPSQHTHTHTHNVYLHMDFYVVN